MLMTLWQRIGALLVKILMLLAGLGLLGWAAATAWFFASPSRASPLAPLRALTCT